ncbi:DUF5996 family protein [Trebonia sp.]|uniref:DUF5996 family protein n=1 Tax=Trebonia sp. TaxID=2767075 RepID=UPI002606D8FB|nr:DUF5996 family protein [Trebonia sp.]
MAMSWPSVPLEQWQPTRDTVHLWTQIVGKTRLALAPRTNHWWSCTLYVTVRGLSTSLMPYPGGGAEVEFDFTRHELTIATIGGQVRRMPLVARTVADFYAEFRAQLDSLGIDVPIATTPNEIPDAIPFDADDVHGDYDAHAMHRFWLSLVGAHRVMTRFRAGFRGKASPVHFFWGAFDLAVTRFSGRRAPRHPGGIPNCPDWVMAEAYSDEVSSCGYWPGGAAEGLFYSYAYPAPAGFAEYAVLPRAAHFDEQLGEFVLPYTAVREAADPDSVLLDFFNSTFLAAYSLAGWPTTEDGEPRWAVATARSADG